jgi:hypothetical protein
MSGITFSKTDAEILYSMPKPGAELPDLIRCYMFINRDAPPPYTAVATCLSKSATAGILVVLPEGRYSIVERWYAYIHRFDGQKANEIESMLAFEELFTAQAWPAVGGEHVRLNEDDYLAALTSIRR